MKLADYFPFPKFRKHQRKVLAGVIRALIDGKVVIIRAPTGFGKSPVALAVLNFFGNGFYTTTQILLQEQLERDFPNDLQLIKGKDNYICENDNGLTCGCGVCKMVSKFKCNVKCPYDFNKEKALLHPNVLMNLAYFIKASKQFAFPPNRESNFFQREVLIVDECHNIPNILTGQVEFSVRTNESFNNVSYAIQQDRTDDILKYIKDACVLLGNEIDIVFNQISIADDPARKEMLNRKLIKLDRRHEKVKEFIKEYEFKPSGWVFDISTSKSRYSKSEKLDVFIIGKPVYVAKYAHRFLWNRAKKIVLMSASIINPEQFLKEIGLADREYELFDVESTFPVENRPIIYEPIGNMKYKFEKESIPKIGNRIAEICTEFPNERIIIHCISYDRAEALASYNKSRRKILQDRQDRTGSYDKWQKSKNGIFYSINMTEGLDLIDDKCRVQILPKVPYAPSKDKVVAKRLENKEWVWYYNQALSTIIQAYGRAVRSKKDWAVFIILDSEFSALNRGHGKKMPNYVKESIVEKRLSFAKELKRWL